jgi:hypothetical protein
MIHGVAALAGKISRDRQTTYYSITGYFADNDGRFCARLVTAITVYTAVLETSFATAYANGRTIYTNTALTTEADSGIYADTSGGAGQTFYAYTKATGWTSSNRCEG